jgi:hypothetical protein
VHKTACYRPIALKLVVDDRSDQFVAVFQLALAKSPNAKETSTLVKGFQHTFAKLRNKFRPYFSAIDVFIFMCFVLFNEMAANLLVY